MNLDELSNRYFRVTPDHPEGALVHDNDCRYSVMHLCTCGLLTELISMRETVNIVELYPSFMDEWTKQGNIIKQLSNMKEGETIHYSTNEKNSGAYDVPKGPDGPVGDQQFTDININNFLRDMFKDSKDER